MPARPTLRFLAPAIDLVSGLACLVVWIAPRAFGPDAVKTITEAGGHVSEPSPELHKFMQDAGKRSWKLFYDTVPNAKEILDSADSYRQAK